MSVLLLQQQNIAAASGFTEDSVAHPGHETMNVILQLRLGEHPLLVYRPERQRSPWQRQRTCRRFYNTPQPAQLLLCCYSAALGNSRHSRAGAQRTKFLGRGRMDADGAVEIGFCRAPVTSAMASPCMISGASSPSIKARRALFASPGPPPASSRSCAPARSAYGASG